MSVGSIASRAMSSCRFWSSLSNTSSPSRASASVRGPFQSALGFHPSPAERRAMYAACAELRATRTRSPLSYWTNKVSRYPGLKSWFDARIAVDAFDCVMPFT